MSTTSQVIYRGNLRTEATHLRSGTSILTDAPTDNNGKGEAFSPTDLVATALASCMITIMGLKARDMNISLAGVSADIVKTMMSGPRRIDEVRIELTMPQSEIGVREKKILENAALTCPVALSLNEEIRQNVRFNWQ